MSIGIHVINRRLSDLSLKAELLIINPQRTEFDLWRAASLRSLALLLGRKHAIYKDFETRTAVSQDGTTQAMAERVRIGTSILKEILSDLEAGISFRRFTAGRIAGSVAMLAFVVISLTYITLVVSGKIPAANRLKIEEVVLLFVVVLFLALAVFPDALARLSLVKLPGGVELALVQIQQKQEEQQTFYDGSKVKPSVPRGEISLLTTAWR